VDNGASTTILTLDRKAIDAVQDLIKGTLDGSALLAKASRKVSDAGLAGLFKRLGRERAWMARDLQVLMEACSEHPERKGTMTGAVHRHWITVRSAVNAGDPRVLVAEVERVEARTAALFRTAVAQTVNGPVRDWLVHGHARLRRDLAQLRRRGANRR
jgi:uncharacterized protein (TIGR02284 family)